MYVTLSLEAYSLVDLNLHRKRFPQEEYFSSHPYMTTAWEKVFERMIDELGITGVM